jgi:SAM-dependent methyltransferase
MNEYQAFYTDKWRSSEYIERKLKNFKMIDDYFNRSFGTILDIGCGQAYESREFNKKYNSELWLIEGNSKNNNQEVKSGKYHSNASEFAQYFSIDTIKNQLDELETKNYHLIDCNNINIPDNIKFDLITSYLSCGYHYPISTYKDIIKKHSHAETKLVFDLRNRKGNLILEEGIEVVHEFHRHGSKYAMCHIKFKENV